MAETLNRYGLPSHVFLAPPIAAEAGVPNEYGLLLYFTSSDIRIRYLVAAEYLGEGKNQISRFELFPLNTAFDPA